MEENSVDLELAGLVINLFGKLRTDEDLRHIELLTFVNSYADSKDGIFKGYEALLGYLETHYVDLYQYVQTCSSRNA